MHQLPLLNLGNTQSSAPKSVGQYDPKMKGDYASSGAEQGAIALGDGAFQAVYKEVNAHQSPEKLPVNSAFNGYRLSEDVTAPLHGPLHVPLIENGQTVSFSQLPPGQSLPFLTTQESSLVDFSNVSSEDLGAALQSIKDMLSEYREASISPSNEAGSTESVDPIEGSSVLLNSEAGLEEPVYASSINQLLGELKQLFPDLEKQLDGLASQFEGFETDVTSFDMEGFSGFVTAQLDSAKALNSSAENTSGTLLLGTQTESSRVAGAILSQAGLIPRPGAPTQNQSNGIVFDSIEGLSLSQDLGQSSSQYGLNLLNKAQQPFGQALVSDSDQNFKAVIDQTANNGLSDLKGESADEGLLRADTLVNKNVDIQNRPLNASGKPYTTTIQTQVTDPDWSNQVSEKVMWLSSRNIQSAQIHLNPAELGPIDVKVTVQNDQPVVSFNVQNANVRDLLEANVQRLRDMLDSNGVENAQVNVDSGDAQQSGSSFASDTSSDSGRQASSDVSSSNEDAAEVRESSISDMNLVDFYA